MTTAAATPTPALHHARLALGIVAMLVVGPVIAGPANYAYCVLDKAPKAQNDIAAGAVHEVCIAEFPAGLEGVPQGSGRDMVFNYKSGPACVAAKGQDTRSTRAAQLISASCRRLYDEPNYFDKFDPSTARPSR